MAALLSAGIFCFGAIAQAAPQRIGDFNLIDHSGMAHQLSKYGYQKAVVLMSQANGCSINETQSTQYKILRTRYQDQGVSFVMLNASTHDTTPSITQNHKIYNLDMPVLVDDTQLVAESLGITKAGEIVVIEPTSRTVLYRGPMDISSSLRTGTTGTTFFADAVTAAIEGQLPAETVVMNFDAPADCQLDFPAVAAVPDYETEVAPILIERCVVCHVDGGIGPFAMNSHQMVQGWGPMIREVLMTKRMPPSQVDPAIQHFDNARNMSIVEVQTLVHWINAGSPRE